MKVLLLGGYGVFGERLARLLVRDGHAVTIAGRNAAKAQALADDIGCDARQMDRSGDLGMLAEYEVVIDAAGPFHSYGENPYRLAKEAIRAGVHYLDLADDAQFCAGISALSAEAEAAGLCVISGLSSVPALSSAAVTALAKGDHPRVIDSAILPGNRAPRGFSVMMSILSQAGRPMWIWRGQSWQSSYGWSEPKTYTLPDGVTRQAWQILVPDQHLFPAHFGAETVTFRAGLELGVMRYGLAAFALLRRVLPIPVTAPVVKLFKVMADLLHPFGTGRGGMSVTVRTDQEERSWRLLAEDGDGPFIPAVPARALLRRSQFPLGARPALSVITLEEAESAMADLRVRTERVTHAIEPIFAKVLGPAFAELPDTVRKTHQTADQSHWQGKAKVERGTTLWPRLIALLFGFPEPGNDIPVEVTKTVTSRGETWLRRFGGQAFRSHLAAARSGMTERFGPFRFELALRVTDGALHYPVKAGRFLGCPLPRWALPVSEAQEFEQDGKFHFDVALYAPLTGQLIVRYQGWLVAAKAENPDQPPEL